MKIVEIHCLTGIGIRKNFTYKQRSSIRQKLALGHGSHLESQFESHGALPRASVSIWRFGLDRFNRVGPIVVMSSPYGIDPKALERSSDRMSVCGV